MLSAEQREYPLFVLEFSEAVKTEDHELQRATVAAASMWSSIPAIKLSGERESASAHGGNTDFSPYAMAKLFQDFARLEGYFYQEWPSADGALLTQTDALSCPPLDKVPVLAAVIDAACAVAADPTLSKLNANDACKKIVAIADTMHAVKTYRSLVRNANANSGSMVGRVVNPTPVAVSPATRIANRATIATDDTLYVKMNRFDHAGDPDRGVLVALSTGWKGRVVTLYRIEGHGKTNNRPALREIFDHAQSVVDAFVGFAREEGLQQWICDAVQKQARPDTKLDITDSIRAQKKDIGRSILLRTIFLFSDALLVQLIRDDSVEWLLLEWDRGEAAELFGPANPAVAQRPRRIVAATMPDEDEVTYVAVHRVLRPNGFKVLCISYPGHQAGGAILDSAEYGRIRSRTYTDIVAVTPNSPIIPSLTESKEVIGSGIEDDVKKLRSVREDAGLRYGIEALLQSRQIQGWNQRELILSIAFGGARPAVWTPSGIDFLVRLEGRDEYSVAPFGTANRFFKKTVAGPTALPDVWIQAD